MEITPLVKAIQGAIIALTKLESVIQNHNDALIHETNDVVSGVSEGNESTAPVTPVADATPSASVPSNDVDARGVPWDETIHAKNKSKLNNGNWKKGRGVDQELFNKREAELLAAVQGATTAPVADTPAAPATPAVPATPAATTPAIPNLPGVPAKPDVPVAGADTDITENPALTKALELKNETVGYIKQLTDFGVTQDDCKDVLSKEFGIAQKGDTVVFGGIPYEKFDEVRDYFRQLVHEYTNLQTVVNAVYGFAGDAHKATVDEGLKVLLAEQEADSIYGVHFTKLEEFAAKVIAWHDQWQAWANS